MNNENSPEAKHYNQDIVNFGLADMGYLLRESAPDELTISAAARLCRSYDMAISLLDTVVGPDELAMTTAVDMKTYSAVRGAYDFTNIRPSSRVVEAGEQLTFDPERTVKSTRRLIVRSHLPDEEHYLPFNSEDQYGLLISANDLAVARYRDEAEIFIPKLPSVS